MTLKKSSLQKVAMELKGKWPSVSMCAGWLSELFKTDICKTHSNERLEKTEGGDQQCLFVE